MNVAAAWSWGTFLVEFAASLTSTAVAAAGAYGWWGYRRARDAVSAVRVLLVQPVAGHPCVFDVQVVNGSPVPVFGLICTVTVNGFGGPKDRPLLPADADGQRTYWVLMPGESRILGNGVGHQETLTSIRLTFGDGRDRWEWTSKPFGPANPVRAGIPEGWLDRRTGTRTRLAARMRELRGR